MKGKTVLFTGATRGMGRFAAMELALRGATILAVGHNQARGEEAVEAIRVAVLARNQGPVQAGPCHHLARHVRSPRLPSKQLGPDSDMLLEATFELTDAEVHLISLPTDVQVTTPRGDQSHSFTYLCPRFPS